MLGYLTSATLVYKRVWAPYLLPPIRLNPLSLLIPMTVTPWDFDPWKSDSRLYSPGCLTPSPVL